jgi:hypothetical protein
MTVVINENIRQHQLLHYVLNKNDNIAKQLLRIRDFFEHICLVFTKTNAPTLLKEDPF